MNEILRAIEQEQIRTDLPQFNVGDNVRVHVKIKEGNRERVQAFEGTVIKKQNGGIRAVSYTHLTLPTKYNSCRSRWSPYH